MRVREATAELPGRALSVDDFMRAAGANPQSSGDVSGVFARGQSRPEEDETLPARRVATAAAKPQPIAEAVVESNDAVNSPIERPGPLRTYSEATIDDLSHPELAVAAMQPVVLPGLYRNGRLVMPAPLKGSHDILVHQNLMADDEGLERIRDEDELNRLRASHQLVDFPESASLHLNPELAYDRRCARVWTVRFAADTARAFYARFHEPLQVNSAVRTVQFQLRLERVNGNAAPVDGDVASPHLTGQAIDFGKGGMTRDEIAWMRAYLLPLMQAGKVDVEEEFQQACFHISVYRSYSPGVRRRAGWKSEVAQLQ
jgi:hypothetical protein